MPPWSGGVSPCFCCMPYLPYNPKQRLLGSYRAVCLLCSPTAPWLWTKAWLAAATDHKSRACRLLVERTISAIWQRSGARGDQLAAAVIPASRGSLAWLHFLCWVRAQLQTNKPLGPDTFCHLLRRRRSFSHIKRFAVRYEHVTCLSGA